MDQVLNTQKANIFYHVDDIKKQQIIIDANQKKGNILFPKLVSKAINIEDVRQRPEALTFKSQWIEFFEYPTSVTQFEDQNFKDSYNKELTNLLKTKIQAKQIIVFDHTIREDTTTVRPPARHAHVDYTQKSAEEQIRKYVDKDEQQEWLQGHYAIINTWRPIQNKVESAPIGFVLPHSMKNNDLIKIDLVYPDRLGEVMGALYNQTHQWVYLSEMKPNEIVVFNMFDNQGARPVIHSAFDLEQTKSGSIRKSIESRILVKF